MGDASIKCVSNVHSSITPTNAMRKCPQNMQLDSRCTCCRLPTRLCKSTGTRMAWWCCAFTSFGHQRKRVWHLRRRVWRGGAWNIKELSNYVESDESEWSGGTYYISLSCFLSESLSMFIKAIHAWAYAKRERERGERKFTSGLSGKCRKRMLLLRIYCFIVHGMFHHATIEPPCIMCL